MLVRMLIPLLLLVAASATALAIDVGVAVPVRVFTIKHVHQLRRNIHQLCLLADLGRCFLLASDSSNNTGTFVLPAVGDKSSK